MLEKDTKSEAFSFSSFRGLLQKWRKIAEIHVFGKIFKKFWDPGILNSQKTHLSNKLDKDTKFEASMDGQTNR